MDFWTDWLILFAGPPVLGREIVIFGDTCNSDQILGESEFFVHSKLNVELMQEWNSIVNGHGIVIMDTFS